MKTLVVYGGRFQPPHKGHLASYKHLTNKFGDNVFMASADKAQGPKDPFSWEEKKKIALNMGVPAGKFIKVKSVYNAESIQEAIPYNPDETVLILAVSQKDGDRLISKNTDEEGYALKKDGTRAAIQWLRKDAKPVSEGHIYAVVTPTVEFEVLGRPVTGATQIREMYATADDKKRQQILHDLYGDKVTSQLRTLFDKRLDIVKTEQLVREFVEFINKF